MSNIIFMYAFLGLTSLKALIQACSKIRRVGTMHTNWRLVLKSTLQRDIAGIMAIKVRVLIVVLRRLDLVGKCGESEEGIGA